MNVTTFTRFAQITVETLYNGHHWDQRSFPLYRAGASGPVGLVLAGLIFETNVGVAAASTTITG